MVAEILHRKQRDRKEVVLGWGVKLTPCSLGPHDHPANRNAPMQRIDSRMLGIIATATNLAVPCSNHYTYSQGQRSTCSFFFHYSDGITTCTWCCYCITQYSLMSCQGGFQFGVIELGAWGRCTESKTHVQKDELMKGHWWHRKLFTGSKFGRQPHAKQQRLHLQVQFYR